MSEPTRPLVDAYAPAEIASLVRTRGVTKAQLDILSMFVLAVLAGAFIGLGAVLATVVSTATGLGFGPTRWLAGLAFSVGLMLVIVAGAELFTGNNLIAMAWVSRQVSTARMLRSWAVVYAGNFVGALSIAVMVYLADWWQIGDASGATFGQTAVRIAAGKTALAFVPAFVRGVLCNALVCLAVWLAMAGRTVVDKVFAIMFPIAAFVAAGFEHSVANMYFIPAGLLLVGQTSAIAGVAPAQLATLDLAGLAKNLLASTLGNTVGGTVLVGLVYWFVYLRPARAA
jgi:formate transporter